MYVYTQTLRYGQDMEQCQILSGLKLFEIKVFLLLDWLPNLD